MTDAAVSPPETAAPDISVVVPVHNESGAAVPLAREIAAAFAGRSYEMIFVDDASKDTTLAELKAAMADLPRLRVLAHAANAGQSRAVRTGVLAARAPVVVTLDGDGQNPPADAPRLADALIAPSQATVDEVRRVTGAPANKFSVIPHGVDLERFHPPTGAEIEAAREWAGLADGVPYVAFLGTIEPRKNVPALIRAWTQVCREVADPPALVLAGGRGWDDEVDPAIAAVPHNLTVRRPGFVPEHLAAGLLGGAEVVAYPSLGEGFGLPVLEGMACGTPVLTTSLLSLPEVGGDAVRYAASPTPDDLADALRDLLGDPAERSRLAAAGLARAQGFSWQHTVDEHVSLIEGLASTQEAMT